MASVNFDTTNQANTSNVFWVVTWMDGTGGKLGTETPGHGLTAVPNLSALQQVTDVAVEPYSNNVGLWGSNTPFYIAGKPAPGAAQHPNGRIDEVTLSGPREITLDSKQKVTAVFHATAGDVNATTIAYFDGNPRKNGRLLDLQQIPHIEENSSYQHRFFFDPQSCGRHELYAEVFGPGTPATIGGEMRTQVTIPTIEELDALLNQTRAANLPAGYRNAMPFLLQEARHFFRRHDRHFALLALKAYSLLANDLYSRAEYTSKVEGLVSGVNLIISCENALGRSRN
jgi:hypothetical protein